MRIGLNQLCHSFGTDWVSRDCTERLIRGNKWQKLRLVVLLVILILDAQKFYERGLWFLLGQNLILICKIILILTFHCLNRKFCLAGICATILTLFLDLAVGLHWEISIDFGTFFVFFFQDLREEASVHTLRCAGQLVDLGSRSYTLDTKEIFTEIFDGISATPQLTNFGHIALLAFASSVLVIVDFLVSIDHGNKILLRILF